MDSEAMDSEKIEEAAARWLTRRESDTWTDAEQAQFHEWLEQHTAHRIAYIRLEAAWNHSDRMRALGAGIPAGVIPPRGSWGDQIFFRGTLAPEAHLPPWAGELPGAAGGWGRAVRYLTVAASLLLAIAGSTYIHNTGIFAGDRYSTQVGGLDTVPLADGSHVTLNTDSRIRVALATKERRIELDKGEAFFEVAHDPSRPFIVDIGKKRVIAVGTKFSVRRENDDIRVTVAEGKVRVEDISSPLRVRAERAGEASQAVAGTGDVFLTAGSVAQTAKNEVLVNEHTTPEVDQLLSWRNGYVVFRDTTLADAVAEFNRYNTRKIVIEDPSIAAIRIGGNFRSNNTDAFLWLLQNGFPITAAEGADKVILRGR